MSYQKAYNYHRKKNKKRVTMNVLKSFLESIFAPKKQKEEKEETYTSHYSYNINTKHVPEIKRGQIWQFIPIKNSSNQNKIAHTIKIIRYKNGYVNYKFCNTYVSYMFQNQVLKEADFREIYKLKEN
jgi:hypothetical protein